MSTDPRPLTPTSLLTVASVQLAARRVSGSIRRLLFTAEIAIGAALLIPQAVEAGGRVVEAERPAERRDRIVRRTPPVAEGVDILGFDAERRGKTMERRAAGHGALRDA